MKVLVFSDLHIESGKSDVAKIERGDADVVVCAGDVSNNHLNSVFWLSGRFPTSPIVLIPGNHEYYEADCIDETDADMREACGSDIQLLQNSSVVIDGVRFLGSTLWSNFRLFYTSKDPMQHCIPIATTIADSERHINDFRLIRSHYGRILSPDDVRMRAAISTKFLEDELDKTGDWRATVVVTHFAPSPLSVAPEFRSDSVTPYFVNDLTTLVEKADLWIHGHTHRAFDYKVGKARVVCNPSGYRRENTGFNPNLIIEI